jgi:hypothetical protein
MPEEVRPQYENAVTKPLDSLQRIIHILAKAICLDAVRLAFASVAAPRLTHPQRENELARCSISSRDTLYFWNVLSFSTGPRRTVCGKTKAPATGWGQVGLKKHAGRMGVLIQRDYK